MENITSKLGKTIYESKKHKLYLINWHDISPLCKKWSRNRDPDLDRVKEMSNHYLSGGFIPRQLFLAELPDEGLVCYDGNHRLELFNNIEDKDPVIIDVLFNSSQAEVYEAFENINKAVQVPVFESIVKKENEDFNLWKY